MGYPGVIRIVHCLRLLQGGCIQGRVYTGGNIQGGCIGVYTGGPAGPPPERWFQTWNVLSTLSGVRTKLLFTKWEQNLDRTKIGSISHTEQNTRTKQAPQYGPEWNIRTKQDNDFNLHPGTKSPNKTYGPHGIWMKQPNKTAIARERAREPTRNQQEPTRHRPEANQN